MGGGAALLTPPLGSDWLMVDDEGWDWWTAGGGGGQELLGNWASGTGSDAGVGVGVLQRRAKCCSDQTPHRCADSHDASHL